jgi:hypothetical protein
MWGMDKIRMKAKVSKKEENKIGLRLALMGVSGKEYCKNALQDPVNHEPECLNCGLRRAPDYKCSLCNGDAPRCWLMENGGIIRVRNSEVDKWRGISMVCVEWALHPRRNK